jgi:hypothetical protein
VSSVESSYPNINIIETRSCPYCQEPWPISPSEKLLKLFCTVEQVEPKSWQQTILVCSQHRAETDYIPFGQAQGWPTEINFKDVAARLHNLHFHMLATIAANPSYKGRQMFHKLRKGMEEHSQPDVDSIHSQLATLDSCHAG